MQLDTDAHRAINKYKSERGCFRCGESRFWCLELHKEINVPRVPSFSSSEFGDDDEDGTFLMMSGYDDREELIDEIQNEYIVLCRNCHADVHYRDMQPIEYKQTSDEYIIQEVKFVPTLTEFEPKKLRGGKAALAEWETVGKWREENGTSIKVTAEKFGIGESTVVKYCRWYKKSLENK